jgi:hypothetical protein
MKMVFKAVVALSERKHKTIRDTYIGCYICNHIGSARLTRLESAS